MRVFLAIILMIAMAPALAAEPPPPDTPSPRAAPERAPPKEKPPAAEQKPRTSDRCHTWVTECLMMDRRPVGAECWCVTPFGPAYGTVR